MKKIALIITFGLVMFCYTVISASDTKTDEQEPYDEDTYGPEAPIIWTKPVKSVIFSHKVHTMDMELDCESCHDDLFEMEAGAAEEADDFTMESLYEGNYCGACHDGDTAFASNTRCTVCHIGVRGHARMMGDDAAKDESGH